MVFVVLVVIWAIVTVLALLGLMLTSVPGKFLLTAAMLAYDVNIALLGLVILGALFYYQASKRGWRWQKIAIGVLSLLLLAGVAVPTWKLWRYGEEADTRISLLGYFQDPKGGAAGPAETAVYHVAQDQALRVDVWQPKSLGNGRRPAVIHVFGGGWVGGDRRQAVSYYKWLTSLGLTVFAIDYRLATNDDPTWTKAPGDVKCAVGWVHANAGHYGVDRKRIVLSGGSAGASLAMLAAYSDDRIAPSCPVQDGSVRAVIEYYGMTDLATAHTETASTTARGMVETYLGGNPGSVPERYARNSPLTYVRAGLPPTLLLQGERDSMVPSTQAIELSARLSAVDVPNRLMLMPATEHAFDMLYGGFATQLTRPAIKDFFDVYVR